jgi:hypothetical protein
VNFKVDGWKVVDAINSGDRVDRDVSDTMIKERTEGE